MVIGVGGQVCCKGTKRQLVCKMYLNATQVITMCYKCRCFRSETQPWIKHRHSVIHISFQCVLLWPTWFLFPVSWAQSPWASGYCQLWLCRDWLHINSSKWNITKSCGTLSKSNPCHSGTSMIKYVQHFMGLSESPTVLQKSQCSIHIKRLTGTVQPVAHMFYLQTMSDNTSYSSIWWFGIVPQDSCS